MDLPDEHFRTRLNIGATQFSPNNPATLGRISYFEPNLGRATLWVREAIAANTKLIVTTNNTLFLVYDDFEGAGKFDGDEPYVHSYVLYRTNPQPVTVMQRVEQLSASGMVIGSNLETVGVLRSHEITMKEYQDPTIPLGMSTERALLTNVQLDSISDKVLNIGGELFRIVSVTADKSLWRVTFVGV